MQKPRSSSRARPEGELDTTRAIAIWNEGINPRGALVERYLRGRGLELPADIAMRVVRFHPSCPWERDRGPCMLAAYRLINGDRLVAVQRTLLSGDGKKIDRQSKTRPPIALGLFQEIHLEIEPANRRGLFVGSAAVGSGSFPWRKLTRRHDLWVRR
jgi:hypothetical protein